MFKFSAQEKPFFRPELTPPSGPPRHRTIPLASSNFDDAHLLESVASIIMVLQDLGRRINAAVSDLTRSSNLDEKV